MNALGFIHAVQINSLQKVLDLFFLPQKTLLNYGKHLKKNTVRGLKIYEEIISLSMLKMLTSTKSKKPLIKDNAQKILSFFMCTRMKKWLSQKLF